MPADVSQYGQRDQFQVRDPSVILVVEDDERASDLLRLYLEDAGFKVAATTNGEQGLQLARQLHPAAIVLDVVLPQMNGWDVLAEAKADTALMDIPIVVVSIVDEPGKGLALGAADYLAKPIGREQLIERLQEVLRPTATHPPSRPPGQPHPHRRGRRPQCSARPGFAGSARLPHDHCLDR